MKDGYSNSFETTNLVQCDQRPTDSSTAVTFRLLVTLMQGRQNSVPEMVLRTTEQKWNMRCEVKGNMQGYRLCACTVRMEEHKIWKVQALQLHCLTQSNIEMVQTPHVSVLCIEEQYYWLLRNNVPSRRVFLVPRIFILYNVQSLRNVKLLYPSAFVLLFTAQYSTEFTALPLRFLQKNGEGLIFLYISLRGI